MNLRRFRPYRAARIATAVAKALPRYWFLMARREKAVAPWEAAHANAAEQLRQVALALEGGTIKAAQVAGARTDVMPKPFIDKLGQFHDRVPPRPFSSLRSFVEAEVGHPLDRAFAKIDETAIGAASLAQVHRAQLPSGEDVVLKIQYPEARRIIPLDMLMARRVAGLVGRMQSTVDIRSIATEISRFVEMELDFEREAESTERIRRQLAERDDVVVPRTYPELSSDRVLVMEYVEGIPLTRIDDVRATGHRLSDVGRRIGDLYGSMLFGQGFFHGDPHPGNLLVLPDGRIGLLDFGMCKELPQGFARNVAEMMVGALIGDDGAAITAADGLGFDVSGIQPGHLRSLMLSVVGDTREDQDLASVLNESRVPRVPEDFALVLRTMLLLNGLSHRLAPGRRLIQGALLKHLAAGARPRASPAPSALGTSHSPV